MNRGAVWTIFEHGATVRQLVKSLQKILIALALSHLFAAKPAAADHPIFWEGMKRGLLELSAQVLGVFADWRIYGIQRDGAWFIYALKFATAEDSGGMP